MTTTKPRQAKLKPHQRQPLPPLVQPPAHMAHLKGEALYRALTTDPEIWDTQRVALESGRQRAGVEKWIGFYHKWVAGERPHDDRTIIKPTYYGGTPTWKAGDIRAWLMRTGKMRRDGTFIPHKPTGRTPGARDIVPRPRRGSELDSVAPQVLALYRHLTEHGLNDDGPLTPVDARAHVASEFKLTERQVIRRMQRARELEAARQQD
jgi:hypothetical protein